MGDWWGRSEGGKEVKPPTNTALEERMDTLERGMRSLKMEWENVYDKLMKAAARLNARSRRAAGEEPPELIAEPGPPEVEHVTGSHAALAAARNRRAG